jgi:hypothetical protein
MREFSLTDCCASLITCKRKKSAGWWWYDRYPFSCLTGQIWKCQSSLRWWAGNSCNGWNVEAYGIQDMDQLTSTTRYLLLIFTEQPTKFVFKCIIAQ